MIRVILIDDHPIVCEGWASIINRETDLTVVGEAHDGKTGYELYHRVKPDVVVIDLRMPVWDGVTTITRIVADDPDARIVVMTTLDGDEDIYRALEAGAKGYLLKDAGRDKILQTIRNVYQGRKFISSDAATKLMDRVHHDSLSAREQDVLTLIAEGKSNREIGIALQITEGTVKTHVHRLMNKLNAKDRTQAVLVALQRGILHL